MITGVLYKAAAGQWRVSFMLEYSCYLNVQIVVYCTLLIIYRVLRFCRIHAHNCSLFLYFTSFPTTVISLIVQWDVWDGKENVLREKKCVLQLATNTSFLYINIYFFKEIVYWPKDAAEIQVFFNLRLIFNVYEPWTKFISYFFEEGSFVYGRYISGLISWLKVVYCSSKSMWKACYSIM
jgi:hypothetical protein